VSRQADGTDVTQLAVHCMVKNRSTEPLHVMKARVIKPKIRGEELPGLVATRSAHASTYGTPHVSGHSIGAGQTLPIVCTLLYRGGGYSGIAGAARIRLGEFDCGRVSQAPCGLPERSYRIGNDS
jgi:hypothetical protein